MQETRNAGSIPGSGRSPGVGNGNPFQYSYLENSIDRGAWPIYSMGLQRVGHDEQLSTEHIYLMKVKVLVTQ